MLGPKQDNPLTATAQKNVSPAAHSSAPNGDAPKRAKRGGGAPNPGTMTLEYYIYVAILVGMFVYVFYTVSFYSTAFVEELETNSANMRRPIPFFGRIGFLAKTLKLPPAVSYDNNDQAWRTFMNISYTSIPMLLSLAVVGRFIRMAFGRTPATSKPPSSAVSTASDRLKQLFNQSVDPTTAPAQTRMLNYYFILSGLFFAVYLHGTASVLLIPLLLVSYLISTLRGLGLNRRVYIGIVWLYHAGLITLLMMDRGGYYLRYLRAQLPMVYVANVWGYPIRIAEFMPWWAMYPAMSLRLISYCLDYDAALLVDAAQTSQSTNNSFVEGNTTETSKIIDHHSTRCIDCLNRGTPCYRARAAIPRSSVVDFGLVNFFAYCLYFPSYISGPNTTYNAFVSYKYLSQSTYSLFGCLRYAFGVGRIAFTFVAMCHYAFIFALTNSPSMYTMMPLDARVCVLILYVWGFWARHTVYWRFFRLLAMIEGTEVPENNGTCILDAPSVVGFWRDWHVGFTQFNIRYIYVPLGGASRRILAAITVFSFTILWHGPQVQFAMWGIVILGGFVPEVIISRMLARSALVARLRTTSHFQRLKGLITIVPSAVLFYGNFYGFGASPQFVTTHLIANTTMSDYIRVGLMMAAFWYVTGMLSHRRRDAKQNADILLRHKLLLSQKSD